MNTIFSNRCEFRVHIHLCICSTFKHDISVCFIIPHLTVQISGVVDSVKNVS